MEKKINIWKLLQYVGVAGLQTTIDGDYFYIVFNDQSEEESLDKEPIELKSVLI